MMSTLVPSDRPDRCKFCFQKGERQREISSEIGSMWAPATVNGPNSLPYHLGLLRLSPFRTWLELIPLIEGVEINLLFQLEPFQASIPN